MSRVWISLAVMTGLVITTHPEAIMLETTGDARMAFIEKPFAWRHFRLRLAECMGASLKNHQESLMRTSQQLVEELADPRLLATGGSRG